MQMFSKSPRAKNISKKQNFKANIEQKKVVTIFGLEKSKFVPFDNFFGVNSKVCEFLFFYF